MTKHSLRTRLIILILTPALLIGLLLSTFFIAHRYQQQQQQLIDTGAGIIESLALSNEYGFSFRTQQSAVQELVGVLQNRHADIVNVIAIFDVNNQLFASSASAEESSPLRLPDNASIPPGMSLIYREETIILRTLIPAKNSLVSTAADNLEHTIKPDYIVIELSLQALKLQQYREMMLSISFLLICLSVTLFFAYRLMRDLTRPLTNMISTVDRIRQGQLDSRVTGAMPEELEVLKKGINTMVIALADYHQHSQQKITQATADLRATLTEIETKNLELSSAKQRAQQAALIKSEFLANISHELRTPLNGIIGFTRQMLKTPLTPMQNDYLQTIDRSGQHLLSIINDVLDFSKLEAGKLLLETIPFALRETLDEVITLLAQNAHEKGIEIILQVPQAIPEALIGDPLRLQQVITNLLGNAIKFTEQGRIIITVSLLEQNENGTKIDIQVQDTGIGIAKDQQAQLFQAFHQADASVSRNHGGSGLGLAIAKKLVTEMAGEISFTTEVAKGSTFCFSAQFGLNSELEEENQIARLLEPIAGNRLLYIEADCLAAQATLEILKHSGLVVSHSANLAQAPQGEFDILLVGISLACALKIDDYPHYCRALQVRASRIILAVPTAIRLDGEHLQHYGVESCLSRPLSQPKLVRALLPPSTKFQSDADYPEVPLKLPVKVLAVDDNPANLKLIGVLLEDLVETVFLCPNAAEAIALANAQSLDIILMDIQMPKIDGIEATRLIHQLPAQANTPIIALTAHAITGQRERLIAAGMADYLSKPIDEKILIKILTRHLSRPLIKKRDQTIDTPSQIPKGQSIDWALALRQAANKEPLARELLTMLLAFLPEVVERVEKVVRGETDATLVDLIHKLQGSCSYGGVANLKRICHYLERQLRQGISPAELYPEWLELLDEIANTQREGKIILYDT